MKIKNSELRKMNKEELEKKLMEVRKDLVKINAQVAAGTIPENPGNVKNVKKTVARILTMITEAGKKSNE
ncbi:50S ribosomal protein L29 [Candidatus Woesearchaeota archaeon]|nr:50S ribosomal protein L29 [Candidatus Woesearchaeota archaeon]